MKHFKIILVALAFALCNALSAMEPDNALALLDSSSNQGNLLVNLIYKLIPQSWITDPTPEQKTLLDNLLSDLDQQIRGCVAKTSYLPEIFVGKNCGDDYGNIGQTIKTVFDENAQQCLSTFQVDLKDLESIIAHNKEQLEQIFAGTSTGDHQNSLAQLVLDLIKLPQEKLTACLEHGMMSLHQLNDNFPKLLIDQSLVNEFQERLGTPGTFCAPVICPNVTCPILSCQPCSEPIVCPEQIACPACPNITQLIPEQPKGFSFNPRNQIHWPQSQAMQNFEQIWQNATQCPANHSSSIHPEQDYLNDTMQWCQDNPEIAITAAIIATVFFTYQLWKICCKNAAPAAPAPAKKLSPLAEWAKQLPSALAKLPANDAGQLALHLKAQISDVKKQINKGLKESAPYTYKKAKGLVKKIEVICDKFSDQCLEISKLPENTKDLKNIKAEQIKLVVQEITAICKLIREIDPFIQQSLFHPNNKHCCIRAAYTGLAWAQTLLWIAFGIFIGTMATEH